MDNDLFITQAMVEGWERKKEKLKRQIADCEAELNQIEQVLQMLPALEGMASSEPDLSPIDAVLAVMEKDRTRLFVAAEIIDGLREMQYAPAEKWGPRYKYLYTILGRLTKQEQIKKINGKYTIDGQEDAAEEVVPERREDQTERIVAARVEFDSAGNLISVLGE